MPRPPVVPVADLLPACRRGEAAAQRALYEQLATPLMGVCLRYCPNRAEAEDALQLAFVKIFTRLDQYRGEGPFEAWARRIAVNTALNASQQHRQRSSSQGSYDELALAQLPSPDPSALESLSAQELLQAMQQLPPGYRTVLNLYAVEGYTHQEIGELLGISEGTSKSQLFRARQLLTARLTAPAVLTSQS